MVNGNAFRAVWLASKVSSASEVTTLWHYTNLFIIIFQAHQHKASGRKTRLDTHTHPFNGPLSGTTQVSRYQKGKANLDFTEARDSEWQWHQLGHMQVCTSLQTDNHTSTPPLLCFVHAGCPSCRPTNSVKALKARHTKLFYVYGYISHTQYTQSLMTQSQLDPVTAIQAIIRLH